LAEKEEIDDPCIIRDPKKILLKLGGKMAH